MNNNCHKNDEPPKVKGVHVADSAKTTQIRDIYNNLRYDVVLNSKVISNESGILKIGYFIEVYNYVYGLPSRIPFLRIPETDYIYDYDEAKKTFNTCVQRYSSLVRAEIKDFQDITVYKDKIGYEKTCPNCCQTCKWSRIKKIPGDIIIGQSGKLECHNPKNEQQYSYDIEFPNKDCHKYDKKPSWSKLPWAYDDTTYELEDRREEPLNRIFPIVDPFGICDNFEKNLEPYHPVDGDSVVELVDSRVDERFETLDCDPKFITAVSAISYPITKEYVDNRIDNLSADPKFEQTISTMVSSMASVIISSTTSALIIPTIDNRISYQFRTELSNNLDVVENSIKVIDGTPNDKSLLATSQYDSIIYSSGGA